MRREGLHRLFTLSCLARTTHLVSSSELTVLTAKACKVQSALGIL
jgi:hypothetical protein